MRELHLLKNAVSPRRERHFGAPQGRDNAEMELGRDRVGLGWDRVGLRLGPMSAYVGLSWPMSGQTWATEASKGRHVRGPKMAELGSE